MKLNKIPSLQKPKFVSERTDTSAEFEKLKASQAYRSAHGQTCSEDLGTAVQRPKRGLIYDAPLGLKF